MATYRLPAHVRPCSLYRVAEGIEAQSERTREGRGTEQTAKTYQCFRFLDMFVAEEKLTIQIAQIDGIKVNDVNFSKAGQQKVFQQLAADTAGTHKKHTRLSWKEAGRQRKLDTTVPSRSASRS